jgi:hypothetical protein
MNHRTGRRAVGITAALLAITLAPTTSAASAQVTAAPVTHRTVYAQEQQSPGQLWKLALSTTGAVTARSRVHPGTASAAVDVAGGGMLYVRPPAGATPEIWIQRSSGSTHSVTQGRIAVFTPGRTSVVVAREVPPPADFPEAYTEALVARRLDTGRERTLLALGPERRVSQMRFALDGRSIWTTVGYADDAGSEVWQYGIAENRVLRRYTVGGPQGCGPFEILPSGQRGVFACGGNGHDELLTVQLTTGAVSHRTVLPTGTYVRGVDGSLADRLMLVSSYTASQSGSVTHWLGALDIGTFRLHRLTGSAGYGHGVAPY